MNVFEWYVRNKQVEASNWCYVNEEEGIKPFSLVRQTKHRLFKNLFKND